MNLQKQKTGMIAALNCLFFGNILYGNTFQMYSSEFIVYKMSYIYQ